MRALQRMRFGNIDMSSGTIWIDITELFDQFRVASHATGVSRTVANLADALVADPGGAFRAARPLFWHPILRCPLTTEDERLSPLYGLLPAIEHVLRGGGPGADLLCVAHHEGDRDLAAAVAALPAISGGQRRCIVRSLGAAPRHRARPGELRRRRQPVRSRIVWLGRYMPHLAARARAAGAPITAFMHDVLLLSHPEWLPGRHSDHFRSGCVTLSAEVRRDRMQFAAHARRTPPPCALARGPRLSKPAASPTSPSRRRADGRAGGDFLSARQALRAVRLDHHPAHKIYKLLVEAWHLLWRQLGPATPCRPLAGGGAPHAHLAGMMARWNEGGRILRLGSVDDASLELLDRAPG